MVWVPRQDSIPATVADVVEAYQIVLEVRYRDHLGAFRDRLNADPRAAEAEAIAFSLLRQLRMTPTLSDVPGTGGPDFLCLPDSQEPFLLEVTHLEKEAVERRSGWPDELSERAHWFGMITSKLWSTAQAKTKQLGGHKDARVLAICLSHIGAGELLGTLAAEWLMTSEPRLSVPIGDPTAQVREVTDLHNAAFLKILDGEIVPVRQSISAILLLALWPAQSHVVGILHPEPSVVFDYRTFEGVPFLRLEWPIKNHVLRTEWVIGHPTPRRFLHEAPSLSGVELHGA